MLAHPALTYERKEEEHMVRSHFSWDHPVEGVWVVEDLYSEEFNVNSRYKPSMTVTNDAENVVAFLVAKGMRPTDKLVYRDSQGNWDEIVHNGTFTGFRCLGATDRLEVIEKFRK